MRFYVPRITVCFLIVTSFGQTITASLGPKTRGKTCIGCLIDGVKDGKRKRYYVYNICDHQEAYRETNSQAISYTAGVPAMIGAMLMLQRAWHRPGVFNVEEFDPDPFMEKLPLHGLPWTETFPDAADDKLADL